MSLFEPRPFWFTFASCRPEYADRPLDQWVDMFFPGRGESTAEAKAICAECPPKKPASTKPCATGNTTAYGARPRNVNAAGSAKSA